MNSGRQAFVESIVLPTGWGLVAHPRELDSITRTTVILWTADVHRLELNGFTYLKWSVETWVTVPAGTSPALTEDALDAALLDYLNALETMPSVTWETATRGVLADTIDGYRVAATLIYRIER